MYLHCSNAHDVLKTYTASVKPLIEELYNKKIREAKSIHAISGSAIDRFFDLLISGKFVRGTLVTLLYEIFGGTNTNNILKASLSLELFQTAILIHDDILDEDSFRRNKETIHTYYKKIAEKNNIRGDASKYGNAMGICIGDGGFYLSIEYLLESNFEPTILNRALLLFVTAVQKVIYGQELDVSSTDKIPDVNQILLTYALKTSEYTGILPLSLGATLAGMQNESILKATRLFGQNLGWIFQIQDDILGLFGDDKLTGKSNMNDLIRGKNTLLVARLVKSLPKIEKDFFYTIFSHPNATAQDIDKVRTLIQNTGVLEEVTQMKHSYYQTGLQHIPAITTNQQYQKLLASFLDLAGNRNS